MENHPSGVKATKVASSTGQQQRAVALMEDENKEDDDAFDAPVAAASESSPATTAITAAASLLPVGDSAVTAESIAAASGASLVETREAATASTTAPAAAGQTTEAETAEEPVVEPPTAAATTSINNISRTTSPPRQQQQEQEQQQLLTYNTSMDQSESSDLVVTDFVLSDDELGGGGDNDDACFRDDDDDDDDDPINLMLGDENRRHAQQLLLLNASNDSSEDDDNNQNNLSFTSSLLNMSTSSTTITGGTVSAGGGGGTLQLPGGSEAQQRERKTTDASSEVDENIKALLLEEQQGRKEEKGDVNDDDDGAHPKKGMLADDEFKTPPPTTTATHSPRRSLTGSIPQSANLFRYLRSWGRHVPDHADNENNNNLEGRRPTTTRGEAAEAENADQSSSSSPSPSDDENADAAMYEADEDAESSYNSADDESTAMELSESDHPWEEPVDWNNLPVLPNRFCVTLPPPPPSNANINEAKSNEEEEEEEPNSAAVPPPSTTSAVAPPMPTTSTTETPHYLDSSMLQKASSLTVKEADEFAWEHGTLLQAVLQLLAERDQVGVEGSMDSTENIWKKGPLKKLQGGRRVAGAWMIKYVELRRGNLCYYDDRARTGRKTIHLRQTDTIVQESSNRSGPGFVFELVVQGSPTRYWMASSEKERQDWIKAIQTAMIGDEAPKRELDLQPYEDSLRVYGSLRESVQHADTQELYLVAIRNAMKELVSIRVPIQWVRDRIEHDLSPVLLGRLKPPKYSRSPQKQLKSSIANFWKNMKQTTFSLNGLTVPKGSQLASERILGSLTRCILEFDKAFLSSTEEEDEVDVLLESSNPQNVQISELQAVSYARNILLSILRSKERQDAASTVRYLLESPGVMVYERNGDVDNPVHMEVSFAGEDLPDEFLPDSDDMTAWVWVRTRRKNPSIATVASVSKKPRLTFVVLSGTVLSYYEAATPRPHGLRNQLVLDSGTTVSPIVEEVVGEGDEKQVRHVLCIASERRQDRLLYFEDQGDASSWKEAIEEAIDSAGSNPPRVVTTTTLAPSKMLKNAERAIKVAADGTIQGGIRVIKGAKTGGIRVIKGAKDGGIRVIKSATDSGFKVIRGAVGRLRPNKIVESSDRSRSRRPSLQMLLNNTEVHGKREPTVQCVVQTTETFSVREFGFTEHGSSSGSGTDIGEDSGWITIQAKLYQAFLMSGGPSGRMAKGDALVDLDFVETEAAQDDDASC